MAPLLRLVLEAGRGVNVLKVAWYKDTLPWLRDEAWPLLEQHAGTVHTVCFDVTHPASESSCAGVLGALPACVTHVKVRVNSVVDGARVRALARGGMQGLCRPLKLTILHPQAGAWGALREEQVAELRQLAPGGGGGAGGVGQGQSGSLLTIEVVQEG